MKIQPYPDSVKVQALKYLSTDALLLFVCDTIARKKPLSVVRMGDGEKMLIRYARTGESSKYLTDPVWLKEYGCWKANLKKVGESLMMCGRDADFICPNISGLTLPKYEILSILPEREIYCEGLFAHTWLYMGRVQEIMDNAGGIGIVCRNSKEVAERLFFKYGKVAFGTECAEYSSHLDYDKALEEIGKMKAHLILCAVGPSGKYLCVEASKKWGKVVLDVGSALIRHWSVSKSRNI